MVNVTASSVSRISRWAAHTHYCAAHGVSDLLSEGLEALLEAQPADPAAFLAAHFASPPEEAVHGAATSASTHGTCQLINGTAQAKAAVAELEKIISARPEGTDPPQLVVILVGGEREEARLAWT